MTRKNVLFLNGCFLLVIGLIQVFFALLSYFFGMGPFRDLFSQSATLTVISFIESFGLAFLLGVVLLKVSLAEYPGFWNILAGCTHLFLGAANIIFFQAFVEIAFVKIGIFATAMHGVFVLLEGSSAFAYYIKSR